MCRQLIENHNGFENTVIIGVQPRGTFLSKRILSKLQTLVSKTKIKSGNVDISFYRDDLLRRDEPIVPQEMDMDLTIEGKNVILIDDVLFTGRTIRSGLDALMAHGRPKSVQLMVLIDRRFQRELPIEAKYIGKSVDSLDRQYVFVDWEDQPGLSQVLLLNEKPK